MKLTAVLLLVTLMTCCYSATAVETCPLLLDVLTKFLLASHEDYMEAIAPFAPTDEVKQAACDLKQCTLKVSRATAEANAQILQNVMEKCAELPQKR
ncbi:secretoglobin family 1D member 2-like [Hemicordylus capensis]|uniref:secretoglobin family 1D member 2-like n=1 Tax=Hemicordylus capensis TaxID=884348 RepID=UPI002302FC0B|nr:secretoglobin family 1D member 2-like [Hemicordylus capensis]